MLEPFTPSRVRGRDVGPPCVPAPLNKRLYKAGTAPLGDANLT